jgi:hypothetical protein
MNPGVMATVTHATQSEIRTGTGEGDAYFPDQNYKITDDCDSSYSTEISHKEPESPVNANSGSYRCSTRVCVLINPYSSQGAEGGTSLTFARTGRTGIRVEPSEYMRACSSTLRSLQSKRCMSRSSRPRICEDRIGHTLNNHVSAQSSDSRASTCTVADSIVPHDTCLIFRLVYFST